MTMCRSQQRFHFLALAAALAMAGCLPGPDDEGGEYDDDPAIETTGTPLNIYGKEINLRPCNWADRPTETVCRRGTTYESAACKYDWKGEPYAPTQTRTVVIDGRKVSIPVESVESALVARLYNLLPKEPGRTLEWGPSRFYNGADTTPIHPFMACNPALNQAYVAVLGRKKGDVLLRVPMFYDTYDNPGLVRATLRYSQSFKNQAEVDKRQQFGNLILALQQKLPDGSWVDLETTESPAPTLRSPNSAPLVLEVATVVEPRAEIRLTARLGRGYGATEAYRIHEVRVFSPVCVPEEGTGECMK